MRFSITYDPDATWNARLSLRRRRSKLGDEANEARVVGVQAR